MTNSGDSDEWWKQYGGEGVSPASAPGQTGYPSAPQYPQQPAPSVPQYPEQPQQQPSQPQYPQQSSQPQYGQVPPQYPQQPYQQAPGYPTPYQPYGYPQQGQGTNGLAIGALVASLAGVVTCGIGSIVGIILGVLALNQIKQSGQEGRGMALAGIWVGVGIIVLVVLWFLLVFISAASS